MKNIILTITIIAVSITAHSQTSTVIDLKPYFSAVIVSNIDSSLVWYQSVLGLKIRNLINTPERGSRIAILESSRILLELIEVKSSLSTKKILENKPERTYIQGFSKIGFLVSNIEDCLKHLAVLKITVPQVWTDTVSKKRNFLINDPDRNLIQFFD